MGCGSSKQVDLQFVERFCQIARDDSYDWVDHTRKKDGPRGTRISSKSGPLEGLTYWRGVATLNASPSIVTWFLRNQSEFNSLNSSIDKEVLEEDVQELFSRDQADIVKMDSPTKSTLKLTMQMPAPIAAREFLVKELSTTLSDGSHVIICRGKRKSPNSASSQGHNTFGGGGGGGGAGDTLSMLSHSSSHQSDRPISGPLTAFLAGDNHHHHGGAHARGKLVVSGYLLEPLHDGKQTRLTFVTCIDPLLTDREYEGLNMVQGFVEEMQRPQSSDEGDGDDEEEDRKMKTQPIKTSDEIIQNVLGLSRVLARVESPRRYFEDPKAIWIEQLFRLASSNIGEFGFRKMETKRTGTNLQIGTHVRAPNGEHGVIKMFDIYGCALVRFDSGKEKSYSKKELNDLTAAVEIGTRVVHATRGPGTVKRFDDTDDRIHVKFDNGEYHRYAQKSWQAKIKFESGCNNNYSNVELSLCKQMNLEGITDTRGMRVHEAGVKAPEVTRRRRTLSLSKLGGKKKRNKGKDGANGLGFLKAECLRISFVVSASSPEVLKFVQSYKEDEKAGGILEQSVIEKYSPRHKTEYMRVSYMGGLNDRDFVYDTVTHEVDDKTYVVVSKSTQHKAKPPVPGVIRGNVVIRGYLIEPLYDTKGVVATQDLVTRVTFLTCVELNGMVSNKVIFTQTRTELIGVLTDMRAYFYEKNANRVSTRKSHGATDKDKRRNLRRRSTLDMVTVHK